MSKVFMLVFLIFGTVVGSGFSSGKEIMVFFSRYGVVSYLYILLAGILFYLIFYFFLSYGKYILKKLSKYKFIDVFLGFISVIFCSCMFVYVCFRLLCLGLFPCLALLFIGLFVGSLLHFCYIEGHLWFTKN